MKRATASLLFSLINMKKLKPNTIQQKVVVVNARSLKIERRLTYTIDDNGEIFHFFYVELSILVILELSRLELLLITEELFEFTCVCRVR
jgi:hypothetical protein